MEQQPLELSEEEKDELGVKVLRNWWLTTIEALTDNCGAEEAIRYLKPYYVNSGSSGGLQMKGFVDLASKDLLDTQWASARAHSLVTGSTIRRYISEKRHIIQEMTECDLWCVSKAACISICKIMGESFILELDSENPMELRQTWYDGNNVCRWMSKYPIVSSHETGREIPIPHFPNEIEDDLPSAYAGELWVNATRAFIDSVGSERAMACLRPNMRHSGMSAGIYLLKNLRIGKDADSLARFFDLLNELHNRKGELRHIGSRVEGEVTECPFSQGSPPEICLQYEAFCNGICEAIDPSYEFAYDRMMTKGDATCHWTIRKKGEVAEEKAKGEVVLDDPAKNLASRFSKGEISLEEFEKSIASLRKHGLVK